MKNSIKLIIAVVLMGLFLSGTGYQTGLSELNLLIPKNPIIFAQIGGLDTVIKDAYELIDKIGLSSLIENGIIETQIDEFLKESMSPLTYASIDGSKPIAFSLHTLDLDQPEMALYIPIVSPSTNIPTIKTGLMESIGSDETAIFGKGSYLVIHTTNLKFNTSSMNNAAYLSMYREGNVSLGMNMPEFMKYMKKEGLWDDVKKSMDAASSPATEQYMKFLISILDEVKDLVFNAKANAAEVAFSADISWNAGGMLDKIYAKTQKGDLERFMSYLPKNAIYNAASVDYTFDQKEYFKIMKGMLSETFQDSEKETKLVNDLFDKYFAFCSQMTGGSAMTFDASVDGSKITEEIFSNLDSDDDQVQLNAAAKLVSAIKFRGLSVLKIKDKAATQKALKETLSVVQKMAEFIKNESGIVLNIGNPVSVKAGSLTIEEIKFSMDARKFMEEEGIKKNSIEKAQAIVNTVMEMLTMRFVYDQDLMYTAIGIPAAELEKIVKNKKTEGPSVLEVPVIKAAYGRYPLNVMFFQFQMTPLNNMAAAFAPDMIKPIKDVYYPGFYSVTGLQDKVLKMDILMATDELQYYYATYGQMITDYFTTSDYSDYDEQYYEDDYYDENDYSDEDYYYEEE